MFTEHACSPGRELWQRKSLWKSSSLCKLQEKYLGSSDDDAPGQHWYKTSATTRCCPLSRSTFFCCCCCSILHRSIICSSFFPKSQGALFCSSASTLSTQISHTSDKCGVTSLTLVKNSAVSTGEQCCDNFPATTQCVNLLHAPLRPSWPDSKSLKTPHNRRTLQKVSDTCQKRYTTQWGWRQRHVSGLQTTLLFNRFKMRQAPRGARWRNETSHSLGNSHSRRTVYVFRVERGRGRGGYISWGTISWRTISWRRQQGPSPAPAY